MSLWDSILQYVQRIYRRKSQDRSAARGQVLTAVEFKYASFKDLLSSNTELLNIITDFEEKLRGQEFFSMSSVRSQATRAVFHTLKMAKSLDDLSGHHFAILFPIIERLYSRIEEELGECKELTVTEWVLPYSNITKDMVESVGGKNANLGEILNRVRIPIPDGFAVTTAACNYFLEQNDLIEEIKSLRRHLDLHDPQAINNVSQEIQGLITRAPAPVDLAQAILAAYQEMTERIHQGSGGQPKDIRVALRSSAIGEDSQLSYAG
jgi:pyruvate,water dikinase